jgi:hypothetical protein
MNAFATTSSFKKTLAESRQALEVQLMYEDTERGLRAKWALDCVLGRLDAPVDFSVNLWRFDLLRDPALRHLSAIASAEPDLVVLSTRSCEVLPASVQSWLEGWFARSGGNPRALVISLDADARGSVAASPTLAALRARASLAQVELLLHFAGETRVERGLVYTGSGMRFDLSGEGVLGFQARRTAWRESLD